MFSFFEKRGTVLPAPLFPIDVRFGAGFASPVAAPKSTSFFYLTISLDVADSLPILTFTRYIP